MNRTAKMFAAAIAGILIGGLGAVAQNATPAHATSQTEVNQYIRSNGGIPPCTHEDGSGQPGMCLWDARVVQVPTKPGQDKRAVVLINR